MASLTRFLDSLGEAPRHLKGAMAFRIVVGMTLLFQLTMLVGHFDLTLGKNSIYDFAGFQSELGTVHYSFFAFSESPTWHWTAFIGSIVIVGMWLTGVGARSRYKLGHLLTFMTWWAVHSVHARCPTLWDGGDNLVEIILIYGVVLDLWNQEGKPLSRVHITVHNLAILACAIQICIMYFTAGLAKVPGKYWQNGTAFYYVLASREFGMTGVGPFIWNNRTLLALMTWGPLMLQLAFPWIYFFGRPWPRRVVVLLAMSFHVGILILMGLSTFAIVMVGAELLLLSDDDFVALQSLGRRLWATTVSRARRVRS